MSVPGQRSPAQPYRYVSHVTSCDLLTPRDRAAVLSLLAQCIDLSADTPSAGTRPDWQVQDWQHVSTIQGIDIYRNNPAQPQRVYKTRGQGVLTASPEAAFQLVCNVDLVAEWDMTFKSARYLHNSTDDDMGVQVGYLHIVYGLPGLAPLICDRDFLVRAVKVEFPDGVRAMCCYSVRPADKISGDPGPLPHTIRAHMADSGYVVMPDPQGCVMNLSLQVDPKGWIPTAVVNFVLEAVPLNILRIQRTLQRLPQALLADLRNINRLKTQECSDKQQSKHRAVARGNSAGRARCTDI